MGAYIDEFLKRDVAWVDHLVCPRGEGVDQRHPPGEHVGYGAHFMEGGDEVEEHVVELGRLEPVVADAEGVLGDQVVGEGAVEVEQIDGLAGCLNPFESVEQLLKVVLHDGLEAAHAVFAEHARHGAAADAVHVVLDSRDGGVGEAEELH